MKKLLFSLLSILSFGLLLAANPASIVPAQSEAEGIALRSNQKFSAENGEYLYLYTNGQFSLDASVTMGQNYVGTYDFKNNNETIILSYEYQGETRSWSGRVNWYQGKITRITILGQIFRKSY